ncbi:hypothetical protein [Zhihengliuella halotolerans]|uniref:hypothetical protein n=1 Tax=Zhihengliuella halotolerans TaxID=370736 RepID=UPI00215559A9|nr:hypothetical protein [Zhihengliuella halotolerans]
MRDKVERGRVARNAGERGPNKVTETQAVEIIRRYASQAVSSRALAVEYGISASQVQNIVSGKRWPHLDRSKPLEGIT